MRWRRRWHGDRGPEARLIPIRGLVESALLLLLRQKPSHGYELIGGLADSGLEEYPVDPSTIYRTLDLLEGAGMVASTRESGTSLGPPRRVYHITQTGEAYLDASVGELRQADNVLHRFLRRYDETSRSQERPPFLGDESAGQGGMD